MIHKKAKNYQNTPLLCWLEETHLNALQVHVFIHIYKYKTTCSDYSSDRHILEKNLTKSISLQESVKFTVKFSHGFFLTK